MGRRRCHCGSEAPASRPDLELKLLRWRSSRLQTPHPSPTPLGVSYAAARGWRHRKPGKREKSLSVVTSSQPWSMAVAAM